MNIKVHFFSEEKTLLGLSYEVLNFCDGKENNQLIIYEHHVVTLGLVFMYLSISVKGKRVE